MTTSMGGIPAPLNYEGYPRITLTDDESRFVTAKDVIW